MAGTVNWGTATVIGVFAGTLYGGSKEASASVVSMHMRGTIFLYNVLGTWQKLSSFLIPLVAIHPVNFLFITATYIMGKYTVQQYHLQIEL